MYMEHYGRFPDNWLIGIVEKTRVGFASDEQVRLSGASGGVLTSVLMYLLETGRIDGAILARQGVPKPLEASPVIAETKESIQECAGSVYTEVDMLSALDHLEPGKRYAITCTPENSIRLRSMQHSGHPAARQIAYVLGPYTGTALMKEAIGYYIKSNGVKSAENVTSLKWRAGVWPGYLEIKTSDGKIIRSPKVYYNFLIPFFVTETSLLSMDFCNEFSDLSVGDAWSPKYENANAGGVSVITTRTKEMEDIVSEMCGKGIIKAEEIDPIHAADMHGHMLDFKKRGGFIRSRILGSLGFCAPDYGYKPVKISKSRWMVELVISLIFFVCRTRLARWVVCKIPEKIIGPVFNRARLSWKHISRPTKRKGLAEYNVEIL